MGCPSEVEIGDNLIFSVITHTPATGAITDADSVPAYRIYEDETDPPILTGTMAKLDDDDTTGFYTESIACTSGNGFENGKTYTIYITAAVGGVTGGISYGFKAYDYRKSNTLRLNSDAQSLLDLKDFADAGYDPATNKVQGVVLTDTTTTNTDMRGTDNAALAATALSTATWTAAMAQALTDWINGGRLDLILDAIAADVENIDGDAMRGTNSAALAATALSTVQWTNIRAGYLDELAAANLPADIDTLLTRIVGTLLAGNHNAQSGDAFTRIGVNGAGLTDINLPNQTMDIIGSITGDLSGSVGSVTGAVGSVTTVNDKTGYSLSTAGIKAIWDQLTAVLTTVGSVGKKLADWVLGSDDKVIISNNAQTGVTIPTVTNVGTVTTNTDMRGTDGANTTVPDPAGTGASIAALIAALNDISQAQVKTQVDAGLSDIDLDHLIEITAGVEKPTIGSYLDKIMNKDGSQTHDPTTDSTEAIRDNQAAGGGDATAANQTDIIDKLKGLMSKAYTLISAVGTFDPTTDSNEAIRDRGDAAWITGGGVGGSSTVTITILDQDSNAIPDASVQIWNTGLSSVISFIDSNSNGVASLTADDGNYLVKVRKGGFSFDATTSLTVSGNTSATISGTSTIPADPAGNQSCRVYEYLFKQDGVTPVDSVDNAKAQIVALPSNIGGVLNIDDPLDGIYNSTTGVIYWDVVRTSKARFIIKDFGIKVTKTVPDQSTVRLSDMT